MTLSLTATATATATLLERFAFVLLSVAIYSALPVCVLYWRGLTVCANQQHVSGTVAPVSSRNVRLAMLQRQAAAEQHPHKAVRPHVIFPPLYPSVVLMSVRLSQSRCAAVDAELASRAAADRAIRSAVRHALRGTSHTMSLCPVSARGHSHCVRVYVCDSDDARTCGQVRHKQPGRARHCSGCGSVYQPRLD